MEGERETLPHNKITSSSPIESKPKPVRDTYSLEPAHKEGKCDKLVQKSLFQEIEGCRPVVCC